MTRGMIFTWFKQEVKQQGCSLLNEVIIESVSDIIITIQNNSDVDVIITENTSLCFVHYVI